MKPSDPFDLDALLGRWPAQEPQGKGGASWDDRADAIVAAALALKDQGSPDVTEALLAPPSLEAEPGEERAPTFQLVDVSSRTKSQPGASPPMANDQSKKPSGALSLKELAARASARGSIPPGSATSTPPPARISSVPSVGATVTPISRAPSMRSARPSDPGREDSGVLRLADLQAQEAQKAEAAAVAAEASLAAAKQASQAPVPVSVKPGAGPAAANSGNKTGMWAGVAIAVLGVAAAFAVYRTRQPSAPPTAQTEVQAPAKITEQPVAAGPTAKAATTAEPAALASSEAAPASTGAAKADPAQGAGGQGPAPSAAVVAGNDAKPAPAAPELKGSKVGTLDEEIRKAGGANESQPAPQDDSKPASGAMSGNLPDQPSQGNAQAAVRSVLPAAKACVAGATEPSSATITFGSSGSVQSVSVGGWAAANGKAGCVKSALQGARVSPFAKPTFTVPANIRP